MEFALSVERSRLLKTRVFARAKRCGATDNPIFLGPLRTRERSDFQLLQMDKSTRLTLNSAFNFFPNKPESRHKFAFLVRTLVRDLVRRIESF